MWDFLVFCLSSLVIVFGGVYLAKITDFLADQSGLGEALMGGIILGASTSIAGGTLSIFSAYQGHQELAISNALGGIALQTFFLCIADIIYKKSNLEHATASTTNILLGLLLIILLGLCLLVPFTPNITFLGLHPLMVALVIIYIFGVKYVAREKNDKMWFPKVTEKTIEDLPDEESGRHSLFSLWTQYIAMGLILVIAGIFIEKSSISVAKTWDISHTLLGGLLTASITSLPELVITLTAVRRGAITLAIGGIIGGNTFDVLVLPFSDLALQDTSLLHQMTKSQISLLIITLLMVAVLLMGLMRREKHGLGGIGGESIAIGVLYFSWIILLLGFS